jgi:hypothetical protein
VADAEETSAAYAGTEQRMVRRMEIYWRRICRGRDLPTMNEVNPDRLPAPWKTCFILSLNANNGTGVFDHVGSEVVRDCGLDLAGKALADVPSDTLTAATLAGLDQIRESGDVFVAEGSLKHRDGKPRLYRTVLLPFGRPNRGVDTVIGALSWLEGERPD